MGLLCVRRDAIASDRLITACGQGCTKCATTRAFAVSPAVVEFFPPARVNAGLVESQVTDAEVEDDEGDGAWHTSSSASSTPASGGMVENGEDSRIEE